jgi:hypothetical protein
MSLFPVLLVIHIALAVALLLPSVALPFVLRRSGEPPGGLARFLMAMQGTGTLVIGLGLAITGAAMLWLLGPELLTQPWLLVALTIYAINLLVAGLISRPNLRRLARIGSAGDDDAWRQRARRQRWVAYGMAAAIGLIGFLMSTKPQLW